MLSPVAAAVAAAVVAATSAAPAETAPPEASAGPAGDWYGLAALVVDGAALTMGVAGYSVRSEGLFLLGAAGYFLGAPLNHIANRRAGAAAGSFVLRGLATGLAVAVFVGVYTSGGCDGDPTADAPSCHRERAVLAGGLVLAAAAVVDDVWIARTAPPPRRRATLTPGL